jgi:hypothetical protein
MQTLTTIETKSDSTLSDNSEQLLQSSTPIPLLLNFTVVTVLATKTVCGITESDGQFHNKQTLSRW